MNAIRTLTRSGCLMLLTGCGGCDPCRRDKADDTCGPDDTASEELLTIGGADGAELGDAVALADLDGDGTLDALAGGPGAGVVLGALGGEVNLKLSEPEPGGSGLGAALAVASSCASGSDAPCLAVGAPYAGGDTPAVYVLTEPLSAGDHDISTLATGTVLHYIDGDSMGSALSVGGDADGDGIADLLVGAPDKTHDGSADLGYAQLFLAPFSDDQEKVFEVSPGISSTTEGHSQVGAAVAVGELDGEGTADLVVGAPSLDQPGLAGTVGLQLSDGVPISETDNTNHLYMSEVLTAGEAEDGFGTSVAIGDWDGDDYNDVLIGSPGTSAGLGAAWLYLGPFDGETATPSVTFVADVARGAAGSSVAMTGRGDGLSSVLIGAPGDGDTVDARVYLILGDAEGTVELGDLGASERSLPICTSLVPHEPDSYSPNKYGASVSATASAELLTLSVGAPDQGAGGTTYVYRCSP